MSVEVSLNENDQQTLATVIWRIAELIAVDVRKMWQAPRNGLKCTFHHWPQNQCPTCCAGIVRETAEQWMRMNELDGLHWVIRHCGIEDIMKPLCLEGDQLHLGFWRGFAHEDQSHAFQRFLFFRMLKGFWLNTDIIDGAIAKGFINAGHVQEDRS